VYNKKLQKERDARRWPWSLPRRSAMGVDASSRGLMGSVTCELFLGDKFKGRRPGMSSCARALRCGLERLWGGMSLLATLPSIMRPVIRVPWPGISHSR
jgi:hypothetical protein